jgi:hypothetical protein
MRFDNPSSSGIYRPFAISSNLAVNSRQSITQIRATSSGHLATSISRLFPLIDLAEGDAPDLPIARPPLSPEAASQSPSSEEAPSPGMCRQSVCPCRARRSANRLESESLRSDVMGGHLAQIRNLGDTLNEFLGFEGREAVLALLENYR